MHYYLTLFAAVISASLAACGGSGGGASNANPPPPGNAGITAIYDVQGSGATSPLVGQSVTIQGVVVGDFQDNDADVSSNLGGFYLQSVPDADFNTSDGVFVFDGNDPAVDVSAGDSVRVQGIVNEHFGETQISASSVTVAGIGAILPFPVMLPSESLTTNSDGDLIADLERYEGMLIRLPQTLTVTGLRSLEQHGSILLAEGGRQYTFTNRNAPGVAGHSAHIESNASRRLWLDDGLRIANATPVRYLSAEAAPNYSIRAGDQITDITGVLRYSRGSGSDGPEGYRLMPTIEPQFASMNPRPGPANVAGALRVASANVLNFFSTVDTGQSICGPAGSGNCRGADSDIELERQLDKTTSALAMIDADIVGLVELENNASDSLQAVVGALNARLGAGTYSFVATGTIGHDSIKTGFIYKAATVSLAGSFAVLDSNVDARFDDSRNRPVLAQTFSQNSNGARLTVAVMHLKSKGSPCSSIGDPDTGDGQGNCNATRTSAAAAMADWLATDPTSSSDADILVIGDSNSYYLEDPMTALGNAGFVNLVESSTGRDSYSFLFAGQLGALDHALASPSLVDQVAGVVEWHINADEPPLLDYNLEFNRDPDLFDGMTPYRSSDHDPLIIGLDLN
ncbi:MAG: ExeM/NucH family extracellular endonuclease [Gammaproteobacteria bacterium]|nr:ExeM/NucH family extracellular endonuclease [Gammaproteobacteria bacterium]MDH3416623.1 ExeM/NucH family extracellular endonuclease [Gammaproteobacteria bacterium]